MVQDLPETSTVLHDPPRTEAIARQQRLCSPGTEYPFDQAVDAEADTDQAHDKAQEPEDIDYRRNEGLFKVRRPGGSLAKYRAENQRRTTDAEQTDTRQEAPKGVLEERLLRPGQDNNQNKARNGDKSCGANRYYNRPSGKGPADLPLSAVPLTHGNTPFKTPGRTALATGPSIESTTEPLTRDPWGQVYPIRYGWQETGFVVFVESAADDVWSTWRRRTGRCVTIDLIRTQQPGVLRPSLQRPCEATGGNRPEKT